jgi:hypothetical protein
MDHRNLMLRAMTKRAHLVSGQWRSSESAAGRIALETHFKLEDYSIGAAVFLHRSGAADASAQTTMSSSDRFIYRLA